MKNASLLLLLGALIASCVGHEDKFVRSLTVKVPADLVLLNGKIITVDSGFSTKQAVAIREGRFIAVGSDYDMRPWTGPRTRVINLGQRTVIPGLIDSHLYATMGCTSSDKIPHPTLDVIRQTFRNCFRELNRLGLTSAADIHGRAVTFAHRRLLADMARTGELTIRLRFYIVPDDPGDDSEQLRLGEEVKQLAQNDMFRFAGFAATFGAGTGGFRLGNYSPMLSLWRLISGKTVAGAPVRDRPQNVTREEALRMYTLGSAWFTFDESHKGSIEPGKLADLVVLNADYLTVPEDQIRALESILTVVGGRIAYAAGPFGHLATR